MRLVQLVYMSKPAARASAQLQDILRVSRERNRAAGITGTLISRADLFLQMLEGPRQAVSDTFARIAGDARHQEILLVQMADAGGRLFPTWEMRDDPMPGWMWSPAEVQAGDHREASAQDVYDIFERIAAVAPLPR